MKLKSGIGSYDQKVGMLAMIDTIMTHWTINQDRGDGNDDFTAGLNEFKLNLQKHLEFLQSLKELEAAE